MSDHMDGFYTSTVEEDIARAMFEHPPKRNGSWQDFRRDFQPANGKSWKQNGREFAIGLLAFAAFAAFALAAFWLLARSGPFFEAAFVLAYGFFDGLSKAIEKIGPWYFFVGVCLLFIAIQLGQIIELLKKIANKP
jgi:hypothetical protein